MKYINQLDYAHIPYITRTSMEGEDWELGQKSTVRSSGCGLCSSIMVADRLIPNCDFDLEAAIQLSYGAKANERRGTDYSKYAPAFAERFGLRFEYSEDPQRLRECLRTGGAAVLHVCGRDGWAGTFTRNGHYIAAISEEPDGRIAILDPSYAEGKYDEPDRVGKVEMTNGVIALCSMQVLIEDGATYHLFWRK